MFNTSVVEVRNIMMCIIIVGAPCSSLNSHGGYDYMSGLVFHSCHATHLGPFMGSWRLCCDGVGLAVHMAT